MKNNKRGFDDWLASGRYATLPGDIQAALRDAWDAGAAYEDDDVDKLVRVLEKRGLGWDVGNQGRLIEVRIWDWPYVVARYRPNKVERMAKMLAEAMYDVDWEKYPVKEEEK